MVLFRNKPIVCPVLIGRATDLIALQVLIDQTKQGEGQVALISGEAGIGKSRLVAEAKTYAASQGFLSLQGNCFQTDSAFPYAPLLDLLRSYFSGSSPVTGHHDLTPFAQELSRFLPDMTPLILERTPLMVPPSLDPQQEKRRLFALLLHFVTELAARQQLLFIVEDLHWSDDTSLELLLYLARGCTHLPIFFVLTYRSDEVSPELRHCLAEFDRGHLAQDFFLQRLASADVDAMLKAIFAMRQAMHIGLVESMYALTEGNPFFIEEVLKSLIASGEIAYNDGVWERTLLFGTHKHHPSIPRSVQDVVYQRTKQLSAPARQVLTLSAVAGRRFDLTILRQVMDVNESHMLALMKEAEAALQSVMPREQLPANSPERRMSWAWGELALASDELELALSIADRLLASAPGVTKSQPIPWLLKLKGEALGALGRREEAIQALEEARRGALARQELPLLWQIHRSLGRQYQYLKQEDLTQRNFTLARQGIASLARTIDDVYLREQFLHAALATLPREKSVTASRVAKEAFGGLTEREREVAALIAQGKSNREIADELVVSYRTVETHVGTILSKLAFSSRAQIAVWAVEIGLVKQTE